MLGRRRLRSGKPKRRADSVELNLPATRNNRRCRRLSSGKEDGAGKFTAGRKDETMKRSALVTLSVSSVLALGAFMGPPGAVGRASGAAGSGAGTSAAVAFHEPLCQSRTSLCADVYQNSGEYVGHDEPSVLFKSGVPGSGNDMTYVMRLPKDPAVQPTASGATGTTWNFQLRPTFWFGLTLCDTESAPEFTKTCAPDSDANNLVGTDPNAPDYIGKHPGNAFMELQFYPPGYVEQFEGFGCTATQYCAAVTIDSRTLNQNTGKENTKACNNFILGGGEPINWAYITKSGQSQAPANPLFTGTFSNPNFAAVNPNNDKDLFMNPGDRIQIHMHDTPAGFRIDLNDLTSGESGSMTASIANGFAHILYTPHSQTCQAAPFAFHPEYSTANPRGNTWSAHTYNVAMSDEIGHFENCLQIDAQFNCAVPGSQDSGGLDPDDDNNFCVPGTDSTLVKIDGCFSGDGDWDAQSYRQDWPGTDPNPARDQALHPTPVTFTSPLANGHTNYSTVAFETDLPRIEEKDSQDNRPFCNPVTGANCVNPPNGAAFYPLFTTGNANGTCVWQQGGPFIPGTTNTFGGNSTTEYGPLLATVYPTKHFKPETLFNNFNSGKIANPCPQ
jgi:hypothetical protein